MDIQRPRGAAANGIIPVGGIIMWSGTIATIPVNWALCNGANGTPDLRDKFLVGAYADDGGAAKTHFTDGSTYTQSGGAATHTHTGPSHQHNLSGGAATAHNHTYTEVPNHVHPQIGTTTATGNFSAHITDTSAGGTGGTPGSQVTEAISTANNTSGVATGTTANNTAGATDNAGTGNTGNNSGAAVPYYALAFIMRTA